MGIKRAEINGECILHVDGEQDLITIGEMMARVAEQDLHSVQDNTERDVINWRKRIVDVFDTKLRTTDGNYCKIARLPVESVLQKFN